MNIKKNTHKHTIQKFAVLLAVFSLFLLLAGCALFEGRQSDELDLAAMQSAEYAEINPAYYEAYTLEGYIYYSLPAASPRLVVIPENARPGEPVTIGFSYYFEDGRNFHAALFDSRERRIARAPFFHTSWRAGEQEVRAAVIAVPSTALIGAAFIRVESGDDIILDLPFTINHRAFQSETIVLNQVNTTIRSAPDPQRTLESQQIWAIFNTPGREILHLDAFERPVTATRRTSFFGSRRVFEYFDGTTSNVAIHAGVDYGVPTGTEVRASATGRVVLARSRILTGNSVVIEHLPGVFSIYYHLDSIAVSEGSLVRTGDFLGRSGATGLATGPHLHWEVRVAGENADPDAFLTRPILDKNYIIGRLSS